MKKTIMNISDLANYSKEIQQQGYTNFLLEGQLGVGKTQFVKEYIHNLGGDKSEVQSPTYTYINTYTTAHGTALHIDMYRLDSLAQAFDRGIFDAIDQYDIVFIEWPRREEHYRDDSWIKLQFDFGTDNTRTITNNDL